LILRLRRYPAWKVSVNGETAAMDANRADGLMAVRVPQGPIELTVDWKTTPDVWAGRLVSALSLLLIAALYLVERRLSRPRVS
jgi:hypothetical protein